MAQKAKKPNEPQKPLAPHQKPAPANAAPVFQTEEAAAETLDILDEEDAGDEGTMHGLLQEAEAQSAKLSSKEVTYVKVVSIVGGQVLVNVGERLEGAVPASD